MTCRFTHVYPDGPARYCGIYAGAEGSLDAQWDESKALCRERSTPWRAIACMVGRDHRAGYDRQRPDRSRRPAGGEVPHSTAGYNPGGVASG